MVRQDQWQSLHDVYVRDRYKLGTREWLEGDNRAAFAQTLERMLDAVRLNYWKPDAATRRELARAYVEAAGATGLRERNEGVQRFVRQQLAAPTVHAATVAPVIAAPPPAEPAKAPEAEPAADGARPVSGLRLEPTPDKLPAPKAESVVLQLWVVFGAALLAALGALVQWRRGRAAA